MAFLPLGDGGPARHRGRMDIAITLFDGVDDLDVFGPFDVLRAAGLDVALATLDARAIVTSANGARIVPHAALRDSPPPRWVVVPGGGWAANRPCGVRTEIARGTLPAVVAEFAAAGTVVASVCTGAMAVAAAGLLAGRPATTHHSAFEDLARHGATVVRDARVVDDGDVVTAAGVTAGIDLALRMVLREAGAAAMRSLERRLEHRLGTVAGPVEATASKPRAVASIESGWTPDSWLPTTPLARTAYEFAAAAEPAYLFNHSVRSYLFARLVAAARGLQPDDDYDDELLFLGCVLHDLGLTEAANAGRHGRFEVLSAAAAATFLGRHGLPKPLVDVVCDAIALHTSAGIAETRTAEVALTRAGIAVDLGADAQVVPADAATIMHDRFPRLDVGRCIVDAVVAQAVGGADAAPAYTLPGELVRERNEPPFVTRLERLERLAQTERSVSAHHGCATGPERE
jgi:putative intracellular protease/amidase